MAYLEKITANKTWVCPKSGDYKIIAVGGGVDGSQNNYLGRAGTLNMGVFTVAQGASYAVAIGQRNTNNGGTTSVGSLISASGGAGTFFVSTPSAVRSCGGEGGYTEDGVYGGVGAVLGYIEGDVPVTYGYTATKNGGAAGQSGRGYGAGGGSTGAASGMGSTYTNGTNGVVIIQEV